MNFHVKDSEHPADALGVLKARIAELEAAAKIQHARLVARGVGAHEGVAFRATVSQAPRESVDWKAIAETLKPSLRLPRDKWSPQTVALVDGNTTVKDITAVRVVARTGANVPAGAPLSELIGAY